MKKIYKIEGMHCASCATVLELECEDAGLKAKCSYSKGTLEVEGNHDPNKVAELVQKSGYSVS